MSQSIWISLTKRDLEDFAVFAALDGPFARTLFLRRVRIFLLALAVVLFLVLLLFNLDPSMFPGGEATDTVFWARSTITALAAIIAAAWILLPIAVRLWVRQSMATPQSNSLLQPFRIFLTSAGVACDDSNSETLTPWQEISAVTIVNAAIYAFVAPFQAIIIPRRAFADVAAFNDFVVELSSYQGQPGIVWTVTKTTRSLRRVVVASSLGALFTLMLVVLCLGYVGTTKRYFVATFDENLQGAPVEALVIGLDPAFRDRVLNETWKAYAAGGWDAASDELHALMNGKQSEITWAFIHADDQFVLGLWRSYRDIGKALANNPPACRSYLNDGGEAPAEIVGVDSSTTAKLAAYRSGAANIASGKGPVMPSENIAGPLFNRAAASGVLYTAAEWDVVAHGAASEHDVPDTTVCTARIKFIDKALSLPDHDAAQLIRWEWGTPIAWKFASNNRPN